MEHVRRERLDRIVLGSRRRIDRALNLVDGQIPVVQYHTGARVLEVDAQLQIGAEAVAFTTQITTVLLTDAGRRTPWQQIRGALPTDDPLMDRRELDCYARRKIIDDHVNFLGTEIVAALRWKGDGPIAVIRPHAGIATGVASATGTVVGR